MEGGVSNGIRANQFFSEFRQYSKNIIGHKKGLENWVALLMGTGEGGGRPNSVNVEITFSRRLSRKWLLYLSAGVLCAALS